MTGVTITAPIDDRALAGLGRDDIGNAERFVAREGDNVRWTPQLGTLLWDGKRWLLDEADAALNLKLQATARAIQEEAKALQAEADAAPGKPDLAKAAEDHWKWASQSANAAKLRAMQTCALPRLTASLDAWNAHGALISVANGTLDLSSIEPTLIPHTREHLITRLASSCYDPDATCPTFEAFVAKVLPDPDVRAFVRRVLGSCLVDSVDDQAIIILHGGGANGKSTLMDVVSGVLGELSMSADISTLLFSERGGGDASPDVARLSERPRLVRASEPNPGARLSESGVKALTSGEPVVARRLHKEPFEFRPNFKIVLSCNNRPSIRGGDDGIWRRILVVPFTVQIPPEERDPRLKDKLALEAAGVLNWLLLGWSDWRERGGLSPPAAVLQAVETYRGESDPIGCFLSECCATKVGARTLANDLYSAFKTWAAREGVDTMPGRAFAKKLTDRGLQRRETNGANYRIDVELTAEARAALPTLSPRHAGYVDD